MQIFVKTLKNTMTLDVNASDSILSVKQAIETRAGVSPDEQQLMFAGKPMEDGMSLSSYAVESESTLHQSLKLLGGHCQVPCGIFDDPKLVQEVKENVATIAKALVQMNELHAKNEGGADAGEKLQNFNQMTRWINTKEKHAEKIITLIGEYCLCQRVKPAGAPKSPFKTPEEYVEALKSHHDVMVQAMKAKQTAAKDGAAPLAAAVDLWSKMYLPQ